MVTKGKKVGKWHKFKKSLRALAAGHLVPDSLADIVLKALGLWLPFHPAGCTVPLTQLLTTG